MNPSPYSLLRAALGRFSKPPAELSADEYQQVVEQARREEAIEQRIVKSDEAAAVRVTASDVDAAIAQIAEGFPSAAEFAHALADNGLDRIALASALTVELRVNAALEAVAAAVPAPTDDELEAFYADHPHHFQREATRTARHLLVTVNADFVENQRHQAQQRSAQLAATLTADPAQFAPLAERYSECPSALHGGLIGRVPRGRLHAELDAALFEMQAGEVRGPLETELGFHLLYCEAIHPAGVAPLDEVRESLREKLTARRAEQARRDWVRSLLGRAAHD